ncbi:MAG: hypothetical protein H0X26_01990 [Alphaproteobacteria bacterium]|nr:hypothetical protein [Alphaproteobacteria bacterium]
MNIYLKFLNHSASNDSMSIFDLEIVQEENCFAKARLIVDALEPLPQAETEGIIVTENQEILFKGRLVGSPVKLEGAFAEIELIAKLSDFSEKITALQKKSRVHPYWDGLWVRPDKHNNFQEMQDVRTAALFCEPLTGELSHSDWFEGRKTLDLTHKFFEQSLTIKPVRQPLQTCTVNIHAHWVQWNRGISNLGHQLSRAFPQLKISTYTEKAVLEKWPEPRKRLGRSGLWILKSKLKPVNPTSPLYPPYSPPLPLGKEGEALKTYRVKRHWFKPILWVRWQTRQKRRETLSLTLTHDFRPLFPGEGKHKTIDYTLQNINPDPDCYAWEPDHFYGKGTKVSYQNCIYKCKSDHMSRLPFEEDEGVWTFKKLFHTPLGHPARSSFFLTDRGYQAAEHAMERAKVMLAKSARCLEVSFEGSWDDLQEVTTDTSVVLSDPRLPGGMVRGKVVKYVFLAKGETGERIGRVTLLCSAGTGKEVHVKSHPTPVYSSDDYGEEGYQVYENQVCQTPSGLSYYRYDDQGAVESYHDGPLVKGIQVINGPHDQEVEMREHLYKSPAGLQKALSQMPTRIQLFFKDMRTKERLDHRIVVRMATPWSAPRGF